jgi:hypothetical protein
VAHLGVEPRAGIGELQLTTASNGKKVRVWAWNSKGRAAVMALMDQTPALTVVS